MTVLPLEWAPLKRIGTYDNVNKTTTEEAKSEASRTNKFQLRQAPKYYSRFLDPNRRHVFPFDRIPSRFGVSHYSPKMLIFRSTLSSSGSREKLGEFLKIVLRPDWTILERILSSAETS